MDQNPQNPAPDPGAVSPAPPAEPPLAGEPQTRVVGLPVVVWVLIAFVIAIAILAWFGLVSGDML